jgi:hypothetical protein
MVTIQNASISLTSIRNNTPIHYSVKSLTIPFICATLLSGCAIIPDAVKSEEQVRLEKSNQSVRTAARSALRSFHPGDLPASVRAEFSDKELKSMSGRDGLNEVGAMTITVPDADDIKGLKKPYLEYRLKRLKAQETYVDFLKTKIDQKIARIEKRGRKSSYFGVGSKAAAICAGIASAVLVTASPANAATVAGLNAFTTGAVALESRAAELGFTSTLADQQVNTLKESAGQAYTQFAEKNVSWGYLESFALTANESNWQKAMMELGNAIVRYEAVALYTSFDVNVVARTNPPKPASTGTTNTGTSGTTNGTPPAPAPQQGKTEPSADPNPPESNAPASSTR